MAVIMKFADLHNPAAAAKAIKEFQRNFSAKVCLSPFRDCSGGIVEAHTLSRERMLRPIARNGHVYTLVSDLYSRESGRPYALKLVGIGATSTFRGFCAHHDNKLFMPIEDREFACSPEQLFLYAYRTVARESYLKRKQAEGLPLPETYKTIHGIPNSEPIDFSDVALIHMAASLRGAEEIERFKEKLDSCLVKGDWRRIVTTVIPFSTIPPVVCSFVYSPDFDFKGNYLQDFENIENDLDHLMVTIVPAADGGFVLLSRLDTVGTACGRLIDSLLCRPDLSSAIIWFVMCQCENFAIGPDWYEALSVGQQQGLLRAFDMSANPFNGVVNNLRHCDVSIPDMKPGKPFQI